MKTNAHTWWLLLALLALLLALPACDCGDDDDDDDDNDSADDDDSTDDDDDDTVDDDDDDNDDTSDCDLATHDAKVVEGKADLSVREPTDAYADFEAALAACPTSGDALAGMAIADAQWLTLWIEESLATSPFTPGDPIGPALQELFEQDLLPVAEDLIFLTDAILADHQGLRFYVDPLPLIFDDGHELLEMGGEWDVHDFANAKAYGRIWQGVGDLLLAFDLEWDQQLFDDNPVPAGADITELIHHFTGLLVQMFADPTYDSFLTFIPGGADGLESSGIGIGLGLREIETNFYAMRTETDLQEDDIAGYIDLDGNGIWNDDEPFRAPFFGELSVGTNQLLIGLLDVVGSLGVATLDFGPEDVNPLIVNFFPLSKLNFLLELTDVLDPNNPIRFIHLPIPIGPFFYWPGDDGWRGLAEMIVPLLNSATAP
jgi:hypothetical protein